MKNILKIGTLAFMASAILAPAVANAQDWRREQTANEWKNIATISGALGILGLLNHDDTLTFAGAAGALYSSYRMNEDLKSMDRHARTRAQYFNREYFYRDGHRYERREVNRNGQRYYQFVDCDFEDRNQDSDWYRTNERRDNDEWRRDEKRRNEENRRFEDQRRREEARQRDEQRRWEEARRRDEQRRRDEDRKREEARRKAQEKWDREHRNDRDRRDNDRCDNDRRDNDRRDNDRRDNDRRDNDRRDNDRRDNRRGG